MVSHCNDFYDKVSSSVVKIYSKQAAFLCIFVLSFFPRDVLDGVWDLIGSVSEGFPTYFFTCTDLMQLHG